MDPAAVLKAYTELSTISNAELNKLREAQKQLQGDISGYASESTRNITKFMHDSITDQIADLTRLKREKIAFSEEMLRIETQLQTSTIALTEKETQAYEEGLRAKQALLRVHVNEQMAIQKAASSALQEQLDVEEEQKKAEKQKDEEKLKRFGATASFTTGLLAQTASNSTDSAALSKMGSGIAEIATSSSVWEGMFNVTKMILSVATDFYMEHKRNIREQYAAAGGTQQFERYFAETGKFQQAVINQTRLKGDQLLTPDQRENIGAALGTYQRGGQSKVDISSTGAGGIEEQMRLMGRLAADLGQNFASFTGTVGELQRRTNQTFPEVMQSFAEAGKLINLNNAMFPKEQLNKSEFFDQVKAMAAGLKEMKYSADDVVLTTLKWSKELDRGTVSMQELIAAQKGSHQANPAMLALVAGPAMATFKKELEGGALTKGLKGDELLAAQKTTDQMLKLANEQKSPVDMLKFLQEFTQGKQASGTFKEKGVEASESQMDLVGRTTQFAVEEGIRKLTKQYGGDRAGGMSSMYVSDEIRKQIYSARGGISLEGKSSDAARRLAAEGVAERPKGPTDLISLPGGTGIAVNMDRLDESVRDAGKGFDALIPKLEGYGDQLSRILWLPHKLMMAEYDKTKETHGTVAAVMEALGKGSSTFGLLNPFGTVNPNMLQNTIKEPNSTSAETDRTNKETKVKIDVNMTMDPTAAKFLQPPTWVDKGRQTVEQGKAATSSGEELQSRMPGE